MSETTSGSRDRRRGLGVASLVLALIPVVGLILFFLIGPLVARSIDDGGWAVLSMVALVLFVGGGATFVVEGVALGLGIAAAVKDRGRVPGIVGIVISGAILLIIVVWIVRNYWGAF